MSLVWNAEWLGLIARFHVTLIPKLFIVNCCTIVLTLSRRISSIQSNVLTIDHRQASAAFPSSGALMMNSQFFRLEGAFGLSLVDEAHGRQRIHLVLEFLIL